MALPPALQNRLRLPVVGSPLFIISNPDLVIAQCKAGIVGSFPALNARPEPVLEEWLERITSELAEQIPRTRTRPHPIRGQPNRPRQCPPKTRHGHVREVQNPHCDHFAGR